MFGREGKSGAAEEEAVVPLVAVDVAVPVVVADPAVVDDAAKGAPDITVSFPARIKDHKPKDTNLQRLPSPRVWVAIPSPWRMR